MIRNPFLNWRDPEIQKKLQSWNKTCDEVSRENDAFVRKVRKRYRRDNPNSFMEFE